MMTVIEGYHYRIIINIVGMKASKGNIVEWEWALVDTTLETTGICPIMEYVRRQ